MNSHPSSALRVLCRVGPLSLALALASVPLVGCSSGKVSTSGAGGSGGSTSTGGSSGSAGSAGAGGSSGSGGASGRGGSGGLAGAGPAGGASGSGAAGGSGGTGGSAGSGGAGGIGGRAVDGGDARPVAGDGAVATGPACPAGLTAYCDEFEGATQPGYSVSGGGITVDTTKPYGGTRSLHFKPTGTAAISFTRIPLPNDLHGRMMMFMTATPTTNSHWNFITSRNSGGTEWSIGGQFSNFELVCDPPDNGIDSRTRFPDGKWVCLQWEFKFDAGRTAFLTQVDGVPVNGGMFVGPIGNDWVGGAWQNLNIGWEVFGTGTPPEWWIDDLAFGDKPIPCPAPGP